MSSFFSDPYFGRGQTLLTGEVIELNGNNTGSNVSWPVAGQNIIGDVKVFNDVNPRTTQSYSNALVYCMACRYTGSAVADGSTLAGKAFTILPDGASFSTLAAAADMTAGKRIGVFDEYFTGALRQYDIVWLTVAGPTMMVATNAAITAGAAVALSADLGTVVQSLTPVTPAFTVGLHRAAIRKSTVANTAGTDAYGNYVAATASTAAEDGIVDVGVTSTAGQLRARIHFSGNVLSAAVV